MKIWWCFSQVGTLVARVSSLQLFLVASQIRVSLICEYGELRTFIVRGVEWYHSGCSAMLDDETTMYAEVQILGRTPMSMERRWQKSPRIHTKTILFYKLCPQSSSCSINGRSWCDLCPLEIKIHNKSTTLEASERIHLSRCQCILPRCVFLVTNDNLYGLMFPLNLYEGIFYR
jgi:hypothetical protein